MVRQKIFLINIVATIFLTYSPSLFAQYEFENVNAQVFINRGQSFEFFLNDDNHPDGATRQIDITITGSATFQDDFDIMYDHNENGTANRTPTRVGNVFTFEIRETGNGSGFRGRIIISTSGELTSQPDSLDLTITAARNNSGVNLPDPIVTNTSNFELLINGVTAQITGVTQIDEGQNALFELTISGINFDDFNNDQIIIGINEGSASYGDMGSGEDYGIYRDGGGGSGFVFQPASANQISLGFNAQTIEFQIQAHDDILTEGDQNIRLDVIRIDLPDPEADVLLTFTPIEITIVDDDQPTFYLVSGTKAVVNGGTNEVLNVDCEGSLCERLDFLALPDQDGIQYEFRVNGSVVQNRSDDNTYSYEPNLDDEVDVLFYIGTGTPVQTPSFVIKNLNLFICNDSSEVELLLQDVNAGLYSDVMALSGGNTIIANYRYRIDGELTNDVLTTTSGGFGFNFNAQDFDPEDEVQILLDLIVNGIPALIDVEVTRISIDPLPNLATEPAVDVCLGDFSSYSVLSPNNSSSYTWSFATNGAGTFQNGINDGSTVELEWLVSGTNELILAETTIGGCVAYDTIQVTVTTAANPEIEGDDIICIDPDDPINQSTFSTVEFLNNNTWLITPDNLEEEDNRIENRESDALSLTVTWDVDQITDITNASIELTTQAQSGNCQTAVVKNITLIPKPKALFTLNSLGEDLTVEFDASSTARRGLNVSYLWDFNGAPGVCNQVDCDSEIVEYRFDSPGIKSVSLTVLPSTDPNHVICSDTYTVTFTLGSDGWIASNDTTISIEGQNQLIPSGNNYSWDYTIPDSNPSLFNIQDPESAWTTSKNIDNSTTNDSSYSINESSYVESPIFRLDTFLFPMVSLDIWYDNEEQSDGALIIYKSETDTAWQRLGFIQGGDNWYNQENILAKPGDPYVTDVDGNPERMGWTGESDGWINAKFALDAAGVNGEVRFRLVFNTNAANPARTLDGMAFRDFRVVERRRLVLIEHFTNSLADDISPGFVSAEDDSITVFVNEPLNENTVDLRYHTSFPQNDPIQTSRDNDNLESKADISARGLFYGVSELPHSVIDGFVSLDANTRFNPDGVRAHSRRILAEPLINISDVMIEKTAGDSLSIQITIAKESQFFNLPPSVLQICLAEIDPNVGPTQTRHIVRKFLPNTSGAARFSEENLTQPLVIQVPNWYPFFDINPGQFTIISFVQNEANDTIYQVREDSLNLTFEVADGKNASLIIAPQEIESEDINLFPNPSRAQFFIFLKKTLSDNLPWELYNHQGQMLRKGQIPEGQQSQSLDLGDLPSGVYTLSLGKIRKQLIILP